MIALTFQEFVHSEDLVDYGTLNLELYVVRDKEKFLYIGMARYGIYCRWFKDTFSHMVQDSLVGKSKIGMKIYNNFPLSALWNMDLWSPTEVLEFLEIEYSWNEEREKYWILDPITKNNRFCDIKYLESLMIRHLVPKCNIMDNNWTEPNEYFLNKYLTALGVS